MWAIEYYCSQCKPHYHGRFFKRPDNDDFARFETAKALLAARPELPIPNDEIPKGDETDRLHRWGYKRYREMFSERQLVGLGLLLLRVNEVQSAKVRHALLTVFSDFLRYQNMLCRYDTYALKCQDIFSVHGFPVGLVQCENNLLGIPKVGSGSFQHFIQKFHRAKAYCEAPFETESNGKRKNVVFIKDEHIGAELVDKFPLTSPPQAWLMCGSANETTIPRDSLDGVFTDPPYFANVQYAELIDFCYVWLKIGLYGEFQEFRNPTTRTPDELTGNLTLGKDLQHFTEGISRIFQHYAAALKPNAPFVFTYHHNDPDAYIPIVVSILDAGLNCCATVPAAAEMTASLHIAGTGSSVLDSVFVCRVDGKDHRSQDIRAVLREDAESMARGGVKLSEGDLRCLAAGHVARITVNSLRSTWQATAPVESRMALAKERLRGTASNLGLERLISSIVASELKQRKEREAIAAAI
jgi:adenine-specific DNA methylase